MTCLACTPAIHSKVKSKETEIKSIFYNLLIIYEGKSITQENRQTQESYFTNNLFYTLSYTNTIVLQQNALSELLQIHGSTVKI